MAAEHRVAAFSRRRFVQGASLAGLGLLAGCGRLPGQAAKPPRVGILGDGPSDPPSLDAFRQGLRELGWEDGHTIVLVQRGGTSDPGRLAVLAAELVNTPVDVIMAVGSAAVRAAAQTTGSIPIVMPFHGDPIGSGYVASLARPGGNVTGLSTLGRGIVGKRLELLRGVAPEIARVAVLWNPDAPGNAPILAELQEAASLVGVELRPLEVLTENDLDKAVRLATGGGTDAIFVLAGPVTNNYTSRIVATALNSRFATSFERRESVEAGGLMNYGANRPALFHRAAYYVDRILKGARPADLPVEQPREFDFVINLKTAHTLGLTIPQHVLLQATELIQ